MPWERPKEIAKKKDQKKKKTVWDGARIGGPMSLSVPFGALSGPAEECLPVPLALGTRPLLIEDTDGSVGQDMHKWSQFHRRR